MSFWVTVPEPNSVMQNLSFPGPSIESSFHFCTISIAFLWICFSVLLKFSVVSLFLVSSGRRFHCFVVAGTNESWKAAVSCGRCCQVSFGSDIVGGSTVKRGWE